MNTFFVYIIKALRTSKKNKGKIIYYTGVTGNPVKRLWEHRCKLRSNFMKTFCIIPLHFVYLEKVEGYYNALKREKQIKGFTRKKKLELIKSVRSVID